MKVGTLLASIGSTEPSTFSEICSSLGADCPDNREEWKDFFGLVKAAQTEGLIEVDSDGGKITSVILTQEGVAIINEIRKQS